MKRLAADAPLYRSHKTVRALKIKDVEPGRRDGAGPGATLVFEDDRYEPLPVSETWDHKHEQPKEGGYFVIYEDGYESWSPAAAFELGYTLALHSEPRNPDEMPNVQTAALGAAEHVRVITPSFLTVAAADYPAEVMRAIAQAANQCGLEGKLVTGIAFDNNDRRECKVILELRACAPRVFVGFDAADAPHVAAAFAEGLDDTVVNGRTISIEDYKRARDLSEGGAIAPASFAGELPIDYPQQQTSRMTCGACGHSILVCTCRPWPLAPGAFDHA